MSPTQTDGYLALPSTANGSGVLVLHAWWGLNDTIKAFCDRLADSGFVVFAPDLYHGQIADTIPGAEALGKALDSNELQAKAEIADAARVLNERASGGDRGLAVIGFSLGAYYALNSTLKHPDVVKKLSAEYDAWWQSLPPYLVNEDAVPPKENPYKELYWKQFGKPKKD